MHNNGQVTFFLGRFPKVGFLEFERRKFGLSTWARRGVVQHFVERFMNFFKL
jgi:hypothetical protein